MKRTISDLMKQKDLSHPSLIEDTANVEDALRLLEANDVGALLVVRQNSVVGVFSERDFARAYVSQKMILKPDTKIRSLMSKNVIYVTDDYKLDECMAVMVNLKIRHLPVLCGDAPIAFLSMRHIMEALVEDNQFMVSQLVTYITGSSIDEQTTTRAGLTSFQTSHPQTDMV